VLKAAYSEAEKALRNTPEQLEILKKSGVVDAGAQGFVHFLEGILDFIQQGSLRQKREPIPQIEKDVIKNEHALTDAEYRYCTETILSNCSLDVRAFKETFSQFGDSLIVAGSQAKMHIHIHTNEPDIFFYQVKDYATIETIKADDMHSQFEISHKRKYPLGIITDSACDLPREMLEKYQIQQISFGINFGDTIFLDNITINSEQFYKMLETDKHHPVSSQPSPQVVQNMYDLMSQNYEKVYAVHVSKHLSGIFSSAQSLSQEFSNIRVVNSKHLSGTEGLLVLRIAQAIEQGLQENEIDATIDEWIEKSTILTDIDTLKYLVRGGRISPAKGVIAKILNLKPIVSVDKDGKGIAIGKSFNRKQNFTKIMGMLKQIATQNDIWNYSIVHAKNETRAQQYAEKLTQIFGKEPAYIMPISPVIGVHNGIGTVAVCVMSK
jgi:DegV family protein with EDD domain